MIGVFEILYFGIYVMRVRGRHYGNESEMGTQVTSKALLMIEVSYKFIFIYLSPFFSLCLLYPPLIIVHLIHYEILCFVNLSHRITYLHRLQSSFLAYAPSLPLLNPMAMYLY